MGPIAPGQRQAIVDFLRKSTSLEPQETSLGEDLGEVVLGATPLGPLMSMRDWHRAKGDVGGQALAAAGLLPLGALLRGGGEAVKKVFAGKKAKFPPDTRPAPLSEWFDSFTSPGERRFEISDAPMKFKNLRGSTLEEAIDHPALFRQYPHLKNVGSFLTVGSAHKPYAGGEYFAPLKRQKEAISVTAGDLTEAKDTMAHELQHAIQNFEKFQGGSNPAVEIATKIGGKTVSPSELYFRRPGEAEARAVGRRAIIKQLRQLPGDEIGNYDLSQADLLPLR